MHVNFYSEPDDAVLKQNFYSEVAKRTLNKKMYSILSLLWYLILGGQTTVGQVRN
jgi:hypothetical protein